jgi:peptidyl-prolyl cis-trans isomerase C
MKSFAFLILLSGCAFAQVLPTASIFPEVPDQRVLAVFEDGGKLTMGQLRALYPALPPNAQQAALNNRVEWIKGYAFMRKLAKMAETDKLDQMSPTREALEYQRMALLSVVAINAVANGITVDGEQITKTYEAGRENFKQVKLKVIYIAFVSDAVLKSGVAKGPTEAQAKAKAEKLVHQLRGGADFVQLVKANSDDRDSREKNGEFQTMRRSDNIPEAIRTAVFSLKQGEISQPIRQPNGFYIFKADDVSYRPLSEVRDELYEQIKMQKHQQWVAQEGENTNVQMVDQEFFKPAAAPAASQSPAASQAKPANK